MQNRALIRTYRDVLVRSDLSTGRRGSRGPSAVEGIDLTSEPYPFKDERQMDALTRAAAMGSKDVMTGIRPGLFREERCGVIVGTGFGCTSSNEDFIYTLQEKGPRYVQPVVFRNTVSNAFVGHLAVTLGFTGPCTVFGSGSAAGFQAIGYARDEIRYGDCDLVLTGAVDNVSGAIVSRHEVMCEHLEDRPPLDEGACMLVLERAERVTQGAWEILSHAGAFCLSGNEENSIPAVLDKALGLADVSVVPDLLVIIGGSNAPLAVVQGEGARRVVNRLGADEVAKCFELGFETTATVPVRILLQLIDSLSKGVWPSGWQDKGLSSHPKAILTMALVVLGCDGNLACLIVGRDSD